MKGYDFEILESFQSYIHNLAENMGLDVSDAWATPATSWNAYTYDAESTIVKETYKLHLYERNIQIGMKLFWLTHWEIQKELLMNYLLYLHIYFFFS